MSCVDKIASDMYNKPTPYIAVATLTVAALVIGLLGIFNVRPLDAMGTGSYYLTGASALILLTLACCAIRGCSDSDDGLGIDAGLLPRGAKLQSYRTASTTQRECFSNA